MSEKLCKATYTKDDGSQQACQGNGPQPAKYGLRGGGLYCPACWANVEAHFLAQYPKHPGIAKTALARITRRVA